MLFRVNYEWHGASYTTTCTSGREIQALRRRYYGYAVYRIK